jgi:flagellar basal body-associated protein FliL
MRKHDYIVNDILREMLTILTTSDTNKPESIKTIKKQLNKHLEELRKLEPDGK